MTIPRHSTTPITHTHTHTKSSTLEPESWRHIDSREKKMGWWRKELGGPGYAHTPDDSSGQGVMEKVSSCITYVPSSSNLAGHGMDWLDFGWEAVVLNRHIFLRGHSLQTCQMRDGCLSLLLICHFVVVFVLLHEWSQDNWKTASTNCPFTVVAALL